MTILCRRRLLPLLLLALVAHSSADEKGGPGTAWKAREIPLVILQTYGGPNSSIPLSRLLPSELTRGFTRRLFDDEACLEYLRSHRISNISTEEVLHAYLSLGSPAHRADLWRYCILYNEGGIYVDIKTAIKAPLTTIFASRRDKFTWYTVLGASGGRNRDVFNGLIATPPRNPIMLKEIRFILEHTITGNISTRSHYHDYVKHLYSTIRSEYAPDAQNGRIHAGTLENSFSRLILRQERCSKKLESRECQAVVTKKKLDRYGLCCQVYRDDKVSHSADRASIVQIRDAEYPWI